MTGGAELTLVLEGGVGIFSGGNIVEGSDKKLMVVGWASKCIRQYTRHIGQWQARNRVETHIPNFVAEIAGDSLSRYARHCCWVNPISIVDGGEGRVAGGAIAVCVGEIQFIAGTIIGLFGVGAQGEKAIIGAVDVASGLALVTVNILPRVHGEEAGVAGRLGVGIEKPLVYGEGCAFCERLADEHGERGNS